MKLRPLIQTDIPELTRLHNKFFKNQCECPDFSKNYLAGFVFTDDYDKILIGGGVRPVTEVILITDQEASHHQLGDALLGSLEYSKFITKHYNISELWAFVKDKNYEKHLIKHGFTRRLGSALMMELDNGQE